MAERITPEKLRSLFLEVIQNHNQFTFLNGIQPFLITFENKPYFIYIKHLSSAYFKDRPDTTRAQLPVRPDFDEIKKSSIPFVFLGYDISNDVYVCWNYYIAKERLNEKESVSFYSRESFQREVKKGTLLRKRLKNDDIPVFFKREDLIYFFENIENLFENDDTLGLFTMSEKNSYERDGKIFKITESDLLEKIHSLVNEKTNSILDAITIAKNYYSNKYPNMTYKDWSNLIKATKQKNNDNQTNITIDKNIDNKKTVKQIIVKILKQRGGEANYSDIYKDFENITGEPITDGKKAGIRATIERASSDSLQFAGKEDLFYSCSGKGKGWWGLRNYNKGTDNFSFLDNLAYESNKKFAFKIFDYLFDNNLITNEFIEFLCDKKKTDSAMGVASPNSILLQVIDNKDLKSQVFISGQARYYTDHIYSYDGKKYVVSSQWYGPETTKTDSKTPFINVIKRFLNNE